MRDKNIEKQPNNSEVLKPPSRWDKLLDSFGMGKRWEKEANLLESLEQEEETPETIAQAELAVEEIATQAIDTMHHEAQELTHEVADTRRTIADMNVDDGTIKDKLQAVEAETRELNDIMIPNKGERSLSTPDGVVEETTSNPKPIETTSGNDDVALEPEASSYNPTEARQLMEEMRAELQTLETAATGRGLKKEQEARYTRLEANIRELEPIVNKVADIPTPESIPNNEMGILHTPEEIIAALQQKTAKFLENNSFGRTTEEQQKFAAAEVYDQISDTATIKERVDALRRSWAYADHIGIDYPVDSELYRLQTGEALRQVLNEVVSPISSNNEPTADAA